MPQLDIIAASAALVLVLLLYVKRIHGRSSQLPLPPGPKGLPIIGNLMDMPSSFEWETYHKWSKELSESPHVYLRHAQLTPTLDTDILHLNLAGTTLIVLDTSEAATELLERRSSIYSGRYANKALAVLSVIYLPFTERECL